MKVDALSAALQRHEVVLLCGAGISVNPPATLPDWKGLRDETVRAVAGDDEELSRLTARIVQRDLVSVPGSQGLAPEVAASAISSLVPSYFEALTALRGNAPNDNHTVIARAARRGLLRHIVSTNWDGLIEAALRQAEVPFRVFRTNEEFAACDPDSQPSVVHVYKIHGCLTLPDSITARIEDEARGLPPAKAAVLRALLQHFVLLVWGYSGNDLKIDLDYLQMVQCQPVAPGFLWNLHADGDWREAPNHFVTALAGLYGERAGIAHGALPRLLNDALDPREQVPPTPISRDDIAALRAARTGELRRSLSAWAGSTLDDLGRLEVMALMLQHAGELAEAAACCERVDALARGSKINHDFRVARANAKAIRLYADLGQKALVDHHFHRLDDTARTHGDVLLVAEAGMVLAESMRHGGQFLPALRAFGYARILLHGAGGQGSELDDDGELGMGDVFADVGRHDLALARYAAVEQRARAEGRLATVARVLARCSWIHELQDDFRAALASLQAADEIARSLGLRREHAVWSLRQLVLQGNLGAGSDQAAPLSADDIARRNELADRAVSYAMDAGDPTLLIQATVHAAIKKNVPLAIDEVAGADRRLGEVEAMARDHGHQGLLLMVLAERARLRAGAGRHEDALEALRSALALADTFGDDGFTAGLLEWKASLLQRQASDPNELLDAVERLASIERRRQRLYPGLETTLARLRRDLGLGRFPADPEALRLALVEHAPSIGAQLESIARAEGFPDWTSWAQALEQDQGADWCSVITLHRLAARCTALRAGGHAGDALAPLSAVIDVAQSAADLQLAAIATNAQGLALMTLGRAEQALPCFEAAAGLAALAKDEAELLDDWFNAGSACEALGRGNDAIDFYDRVLSHPRAGKDPAVALNASMRRGEVAKAVGRLQNAVEAFESAEPLARAMNRPKDVMHVIQRLGKIHLDLGNHEASIRYRSEAANLLAAQGAPSAAGAMAWLAANTYLNKLGRPRDAMPLYEQAVACFARESDPGQRAQLEAERDHCRTLVDAARNEPPALYDLLTEMCDSPRERDHTLLRTAVGMGFDVWHFEPRSFAAYCEGGSLVELPPAGAGAAPIRFPLRWPMLLSALGGAADYENQKGDAGESTRLSMIAARLATAWSLPPDLGIGMHGRSTLGRPSNP